jgi:hypothetical protein
MVPDVAGGADRAFWLTVARQLLRDRR